MIYTLTRKVVGAGSEELVCVPVEMLGELYELVNRGGVGLAKNAPDPDLEANRIAILVGEVRKILDNV